MDMAVVNKHRAVTVREVKAWAESGDPRSVIDVLITPEIAKALLKYNSSGETNRNLSQSYVDAAALAMRNGEWENTGEAIIMSDDGLLNDGQHRLRAIVESGLSCVMDLRFGVKRSAFASTNSGRKRSGGDALTIAHIREASTVAAAARLALTYQIGLPSAARQRVENTAIVRAVQRWPDIEAAVAVTGTLRKPFRNAATNTLAFFAMRTANDASVREFFEILRWGEGKADNPPHMLRDFMTISPVGQGRDTGTKVRAFAACIIAWNAWRKPGKSKPNLYWKESQRFPVCEDLKL